MSAESDRIYALHNEAAEEYWRVCRRRGFLEVLKQRCIPHDNRGLNRFQRWFYTFKTMVCILLNRTKSMTSNCLDCVAFWDQHPYCGEYDGWEWEELSVGYGVFRNWYFDIYNNSSV